MSAQTPVGVVAASFAPGRGHGLAEGSWLGDVAEVTEGLQGRGLVQRRRVGSGLGRGCGVRRPPRPSCRRVLARRRGRGVVGPGDDERPDDDSDRDRGGHREEHRQARSPSTVDLVVGKGSRCHRGVDEAPPGQLVEWFDGEERRDLLVARAVVGRRGGVSSVMALTWTVRGQLGVPERGRQGRATARDPGPDGSRGHVEHLGDLGVVEVAEIPQDHRDAELLGHVGQRRVDIESGSDLLVEWRRRRRRLGQRLDRSRAGALARRSSSSAALVATR